MMNKTTLEINDMTLKAKHCVTTNVGSHGLCKMFALLALLLLGLSQPLTVTAKDIPGATQTSYGVSTSGAFQFSIPLVVPQGRNSVQPNLAINFSSSSGNGPLGVGWGLSGLSAITRCGRTLATNGIAGGVLHDAKDRYCLNGQQLIRVAGSVYGGNGTEYRTEIDSFAKVVSYVSGSVNLNGGTAPTRWRVWTKGGSIHDYGAPAGSTSHSAQFKLPGTNSIHSWKLSRVSDRNGNFYEVTYRSADGLPDEISYLDKKVEFNYEAREDTRQRYVLGSKISSTVRLSSVLATQAGQTTREYRLDYSQAPISNNTRLDSVTECGLSGGCMPPIAIIWKSGEQGYASSSSASEKAPENLIEYETYTRNTGGTPESGSVKTINRGTWADVNADGEVDLIIAYQPTTGPAVYKTYLKTESGWSSDQSNWHLPRPLRSYDEDIVNTLQARFAPDVINMGQLADVNNDGLVDVVYSYRLDKDRRQRGYSDLSVSNIEEVRETWLNTGYGWVLSGTNWAPRDLLFDYLTNGGDDYLRVETVRGRLFDINGDGMVDWVTAYFKHTQDNTGIEYKQTWLNQGSTWLDNIEYIMPDVFAHYRGIYSIPHGQFVDVNGDGLPDWVQAYKASEEPAKFGTWVNTGSGFLASGSNYHLPEVIYQNENGWNDISPVMQGSFVDVNGDGLRDWVRSYETVGGFTSTATLLNTGNGWQLNEDFKPPFINANFRYSLFERGWPVNRRGTYIDLNGDGLVDYVESYISSEKVDGDFITSKRAWLNTGHAWLEEPAGSVYIPTEFYYDYSGREQAKPQLGSFIDINSDGAADWVSISGETVKKAFVRKTPRPDLIESVFTTMGVEVGPNFLPLTDNDYLYLKKRLYTDPLPDGRFIEAPIYVVSALNISRPDGIGYNTTSYRYEGAQVSRRRGFLGFNHFSSTSSLTGLTKVTEFSHTFPYIGRPTLSVTSEGADILSLSVTTYEHTENVSAEYIETYFPHVSSTHQEQAELGANGGALYRLTDTNLTYDSYGNVKTQITNIANNASTTLHTSTVTNIYEPVNLGSWLISRVKKNTQVNQTVGKNAISNSTAYTYDPVYPWRLKTVNREPDATDDNIRLTTAYDYDAYGNVTSETSTTPSNPDARTNTIGYDTQHRLPISITNSLSQQSFIDYHPQCDQPSKVTDANGLETTYGYDGFCRQTSELSPEQISASVAYSTSPLACNECQTGARFSITSSVQGEPDVTQYLNAFGQPMLTTTLGMDSTLIKQETVYDIFGRTAASTQPYFDGQTKFWTDYEYDILGRIKKTRLPYNDESGSRAETNYNYAVVNQFIERSGTDAKGRTSRSRVNALGQVAQVIDAHNKAMSYSYDSQGNLSQTIDVAGNTINLQYDALGRRVQLSDPDLGVSSYVFDGFSDLTSQTDAKSQVISMGYDVLGRLTQRTVPGTAAQSGGLSTWEYDTTPKSGGGTWLGAISEVAGPNGYQQTFEYDQYGRPIGDSTIIKGITFNERYGYNNDGYLSERYYPNSGVGADTEFGVKYEYQNGYLVSVMSTENAQGQCIEHWRANSYDALGRVDDETVGKFINTTRRYKGGQNVLEQISSITMGANAQMVQDLNYVYDAVNNLKSRQDLTKNTLETFEYDNLDRLRFHRKDGNDTEVRYDDIGNITYKSDVGDYVYPASGANSVRPHALTQVTGSVAAGTDLTQFTVNWEFDGAAFVKALPSIHNQVFEYDNNGNVTKSGDREIGWTAFDKPERILARVKADGTMTGSVMEYGPEQQRIFKQEATFSSLNQVLDYKDSTIYLGKYYERITDNNNVVTHRYTIQTGGASIQIEREDGSGRDTPKYLLTDNLGSTNVVVNGLGGVEQRLAFDPWGMRLNVGDNSGVNSVTNRGYTGHEMDDEVGLINMNARIYDPYLGRFLSADPVLPDAWDMQQFNRYSYVGNNPLKYVDPTGNSGVCGEFVTCSVSWLAFAYDILSGWGSARPQEPCPDCFGGPGSGLDGLSGISLGLWNFEHNSTSENSEGSGETSVGEAIVNVLGTLLDVIAGSPSTVNPGNGRPGTDGDTRRSSCLIGGCSFDPSNPILYAMPDSGFGGLFGGERDTERDASPPYYETQTARDFNKVLDMSKDAYIEAYFLALKEYAIGAVFNGVFIGRSALIFARVGSATKGADETVDVFRVFGGDARAQGFSFTTVNPSTIKNFRDGAGLPSGGASGATNSADFLIKGTANVKDIIKSRSALPLDGNKGGLPELIIDPKNVKITDFSVIKP